MDNARPLRRDEKRSTEGIGLWDGLQGLAIGGKFLDKLDLLIVFDDSLADRTTLGYLKRMRRCHLSLRHGRTNRERQREGETERERESREEREGRRRSENVAMKIGREHEATASTSDDREKKGDKKKKSALCLVNEDKTRVARNPNLSASSAASCFSASASFSRTRSSSSGRRRPNSASLLNTARSFPETATIARASSSSRSGSAITGIRRVIADKRSENELECSAT